MTNPARVLKAARGASRRQNYSSGTKRALTDSAITLFTAHGYAGTSLDEVVAAARVTKGALYHHFPSKLALFESVFLKIQSDTSEQIVEKINVSKDPWQRARIGLAEFMKAAQDPQYRRICMQEGPVALGHERWSDAEREAVHGILRRSVQDLLEDLGGGDDLLDAFAAVFYGAIRSASEYVADDEDSGHAAEQVQAAIGTMLAGMQMLGDLDSAADAETPSLDTKESAENPA